MIEVDRPITVTVATARKISGLGNTTIWKMIGDGTLQSITVGRRRLVDYGSLCRLLTTGDQPASEQQPLHHRGRPRKINTKAVTT